MTTIAYRNRTIACDSSLTYKAEWVGDVQKIWKFKTGCLYGARGEGDDRALRALLEKVRKPADIPSVKKLSKIKNDVTALLVFPNEEIWHVRSGEDCAEAMRVDREYHAIGSGRKYALGAMHAGATAKGAVAAAIEGDLHSDGEIQVLSL